MKADTRTHPPREPRVEGSRGGEPGQEAGRWAGEDPSPAGVEEGLEDLPWSVAKAPQDTQGPAGVRRHHWPPGW